jgi:hypothetical protein
MAGGDPEISVIVGAQDAQATIVECLRSLTVQAARGRVEIIVAGAARDCSVEIAASQFPQVLIVRGAAGSLVPHLWRLGYDQSRGRLVAFTNAHCIPADDWLEQMLAAHQAEIAGVGGPIEGPARPRATDWALYFARYSAYLPPGQAGPVDEIAGDNAAYKRAALELCQREMAGGFWETLAHRRLRAEGMPLIFNPNMRVRLGAVSGGTSEQGGASVTPLAAVRFRHGRHYGSTRPGSGWLMRMARLAATPLLLPALLSRIAGRVRRDRPDWMPHFVRALPALIAIVGAWTIGEAAGYAWPQAPTAPRLAEQEA